MGKDHLGADQRKVKDEKKDEKEIKVRKYVCVVHQKIKRKWEE